VHVAGPSCITLVALTPTCFSIPENPALLLEFDLDGGQVQKLTLRAGPLAVTYTPNGHSAG
jgi:hypothetical protein